MVCSEPALELMWMESGKAARQSGQSEHSLHVVLFCWTIGMKLTVDYNCRAELALVSWTVVR